MNAFNQKELIDDESGLLESCDCCNALIFNWDWVGEMAFLTFDGKIICVDCRKNNPSLCIG